MSVVKSQEIPAMFLELAKELRALGCTRLEAMGFVACFGPAQQADAPRPEKEQRALSAEAKELAARAQKWAGGAGQ